MNFTSTDPVAPEETVLNCRNLSDRGMTLTSDTNRASCTC